MSCGFAWRAWWHFVTVSCACKCVDSHFVQHAQYTFAYSPLHTSHSTHHVALHSTLHSLDFALYSARFTPHTLVFTPYTPHSTLPSLHFTLCTPHFTLRTLHSTLHTLHSTLYNSNSTHHTSQSMPHTPLCTLHALHSCETTCAKRKDARLISWIQVLPEGRGWCIASNAERLANGRWFFQSTKLYSSHAVKVFFVRILKNVDESILG